MIRFSKSSGPLLAHKTGFFEENDKILAEINRINSVYLRQPRRTNCKCCDRLLDGERFTKNEIDYVLCGTCGHLNGIYQDSDVFCEALYTDDGGANYAKNYSAASREAYASRVRDIYVPKAEFLRDGLQELGEDAGALNYADFGAGSGYFVAALRQIGLKKSQGYEVSETQVALAEAMIEAGSMVHHDLEVTVGIAAEIKADVISMIGVLEHVQHPRPILSALSKNPSVRYLYFSVPLFSPCVILEAVFPNVFQRQLSAGHTHLFTEQSIDWMCKEFGMTREAEWWFGTDLVDLYRSVAVELERNDGTATLATHWRQMIVPLIDDMQHQLDKAKHASEVHMLLRFAD